VSNRKDANAGKEKLVGERENIMGTDFANGPVALTRGFAGMSVKAGTLGIVNPKTNAILNKLPKSKVREGEIRETIDIRANQAKDKEDKNPAGKVFPAKPSLSSIPGLPKLSP
jgi:hypothetical protein